MLNQYSGQINIGPGTLEDILMEGLKKRGMLSEDATSVYAEFQAKSIFGNQKKVRVNVAIVNFTTVEDPKK
jgi:hypothetical protein